MTPAVAAAAGELAGGVVFLFVEASVDRGGRASGAIEMDRDSQRAAIKETRSILRRVQAHYFQTHMNLGAQTEVIGFSELVHHDSSPLASLNYVMPRRNTAWVSGKHLEQGMEALREKDRRARVRFADGLFPPMFMRELHDLGLVLETQIPIVVQTLSTENPPVPPTMPEECRLVTADDPQSMGIWWYVWRNAYYDVLTSSVHPFVLGHDLQRVYHKQQTNLILYRYGFPAAVLRLTFHEQSANIAALALFRELRTPTYERLLRQWAVMTALQAGCDLVFAPGHSQQERQTYRDLGFVDAGNIVVYAERTEYAAYDDSPEASLLVV